MSEPRLSISSRRSQDSRSGGSVSHGRGGAGNIGLTPDPWSSVRSFSLGIFAIRFLEGISYGRRG